MAKNKSFHPRTKTNHHRNLMYQSLRHFGLGVEESRAVREWSVPKILVYLCNNKKRLNNMRKKKEYLNRINSITKNDARKK